MNDNPVKGSCFCGRAAFEYDGLPSGVIHCHCGMCRRLSGAAFTTWISIPKQNFRLLSSGTLKKFSLSNNAVRNFCSECGTHVFTEDARYPDVIAIPAGVVAGALQRKIDGHYFVSDKAEWHIIGDELPQFGGETGFERISV
ncbi:GFA family protein [Paucimonas lemoignei]|uniref:GFA family protein n=1 Tax=Paucimonas lemoignei TaxID=29443 RepID=UPI0014052357|nr:GFA family protein [Paucimonas lemoignei]